MVQGPKSSRLVARFSVRLRREGGSLSITIPRYIVRHWKLEAGMRLVVRATNQGILLFPRYFLPYSGRLRHRRAKPERERPDVEPVARAGREFGENAPMPAGHAGRDPVREVT
jgi:antitoxin component of MazEF toxin-antitoxin module